MLNINLKRIPAKLEQNNFEFTDGESLIFIHQSGAKHLEAVLTGA